MGFALHACEFCRVYRLLALIGAQVKTVAIDVNEVVPVSVLSSFKVEHPRRSAHLATRIPESFVLVVNIFPSSFVFVLVHGIAGMRAIAARWVRMTAAAAIVSEVTVKGVSVSLRRFCEPSHALVLRQRM